MSRVTVEQFESLLRENTHWIDVRAPVEFHDGAVPGAVNLPILNDEERHVIGTTYKEKGQDAAVRLGHELVSGNVKQSRVDAWAEEVRRHPEAVIYCFRGGMRSQLAQSWLAERGVHRPIVTGGYKALRRFLLRTLEKRAQELSLRIVSGPTGAGKTEYLAASGKPFLDLEALANHRGSAFGGFSDPQPSQGEFENQVARALLRLPQGEILVEDESRMIGKLIVPEPLFAKMKSSPRLLLEIPLEQRVENIYRGYILGADVARFQSFRSSVRDISKKLGGLLTKEILEDIQRAEDDFLAGHGLTANRDWIRKLLAQYYDPLYARWNRAAAQTTASEAER